MEPATYDAIRGRLVAEHAAASAARTLHRTAPAVRRGDDLARFRDNESYSLSGQPPLPPGYAPDGSVRGLSVTPFCAAVEMSAWHLDASTLSLHVRGTRVYLSDPAPHTASSQLYFLAVRCHQHAVPEEDAVDAGLLTPDAAAAITTKAARNLRGASAPGLAVFRGAGVVTPVLGFVWDAPGHGTLFPLSEIGEHDTAVFADARGGAPPGGGVASASWEPSGAVTLDDAVIDRTNWALCEGGRVYAVVPSSVRNAVARLPGGLLAERVQSVPLLSPTLRVLLAAWRTVAAPPYTELAPIRALDDVITRIMEGIVGLAPPDVRATAGLLTAADLDVAAAAVEAHADAVTPPLFVGVDPPPHEELDAARTWLDAVLPALQDLAVEAAPERSPVTAHHVPVGCCTVDGVQLSTFPRGVVARVVTAANGVWVLAERELAPGQSVADAVAASHADVARACGGLQPDVEGVVDVKGVTADEVPVLVAGQHDPVRVHTSSEAAAACGAPTRRGHCSNRTLHESRRCHYHRLPAADEPAAPAAAAPKI
jgi:hypothetical protein